jgi:hypothetical protein
MLRDSTGFVAVYPTGRTLPPSFLQPDFAARYGIVWKHCSQAGAPELRCVAGYETLSPGEPEAIVLVTSRFSGSVFEQDPRGEWRQTGVLTGGPLSCLMQALRSGPLGLKPHVAPDIVVDRQPLTILPAARLRQPCPEDEPLPN